MTYESLAKQVREVLGLPRARHLTSYQDPTYRAVRAVFQTIIKALRRGETIRIIGLGTFRLITIKEQKIHAIFTNKFQSPLPFSADKTAPSIIHVVPEHKRVSFIPCKSLKRLINEPQPHSL